MFQSVRQMEEALIDTHRYGAWSCEWSAHPEDVFIELQRETFEHPVFVTNSDPVIAVQVLTRKGIFWTWSRELDLE